MVAHCVTPTWRSSRKMFQEQCHNFHYGSFDTAVLDNSHTEDRMSDGYSIKYKVENNTDITKTCTLKWNIENFIDFIKEVEAKHISDLRTNTADIADYADKDTKFLLKIVFLGKETNLFEIYFLAPVPLYMKCKLADRYDNILAEQEYCMVQPNKWQFLVSKDRNEIKGICYYGKLTLDFEFTINKVIKDVDPSYRPKAQLNCDLENLFNSSSFSDVTIKSTEGVDFQTHKIILATRSPVLKAHFEHNTVESVTNIIKTSLETEVLKEVLTYIYTDNTPKVNEMPEKLLAAAEYYQMSRLKHLCEEALFQKLTVENAIATLELADLHSAANLKKNTLDFIRDGHASLIIKTKGWMKLQPGALVKTLFEHIFSNDCIKVSQDD